MSAHNPAHHRQGFTLVELLVVIAIIGMLIAMLLPAVQRAREQGRRAACINQLSQLALATINYETDKGYYPGYANVFTFPTTTAGTNVAAQLSWATVLSPYLERADLWRALGPLTPYPTTSAAITERLEKHPRWGIFLCPSNPPDATSAPSRMSYVANGGCLDNAGATARDFSANGLFHNLTGATSTGPKVSSSWLSTQDGASTTAMLSENVNAGNWYELNEINTCMLWTPQIDGGAKRPKSGYEMYMINYGKANGEVATTLPPPTATGATYARPSSMHNSGVNVAFADRHVKFINEDIDYVTWFHLMTPSSFQAADPSASPVTIDTGIKASIVDESNY